MKPLREIRVELGQLLGASLDVIAPAFGGQINPPCVVVQPGDPYLEPHTYDTEKVRYDVLVCAPPGDQPAVLDALDDLVDKVRDSLRSPSPAGLRFSWAGTVAPAQIDVPGSDRPLLAVVVQVTHERECD